MIVTEARKPKKRSLFWCLKVQKGDSAFHSGGDIFLYSFGRNTKYDMRGGFVVVVIVGFANMRGRNLTEKTD